MEKNAAEKIAVGVLLVHEAVLKRVLHGVHQLHRLLVEPAEQIPHHHADVVRRALALQQLVVLLRLLRQRRHQVLHQSDGERERATLRLQHGAALAEAVQKVAVAIHLGLLVLRYAALELLGQRADQRLGRLG